MALPPDFESRLAAMPDQELLEMVGHGSDYRPEALEVAQRELQRRNVDPKIAAKVETSLQMEAASAEVRANRPLPWFWRIFNLIFPLGIMQTMIADRYWNKGYLRCHRECWSWTRRGIAFWVIFSLSSVGLNYIWPTSDPESVDWAVALACMGIVLGVFAAIDRRAIAVP
jgi:hypothetical protein